MRKQHIKNKLIYGVGINDYDGRVKIDGKNIKSYDAWRSMLQRCYDPKFHERRPTYTGCSVCDSWLSFTNFKAWFDNHYREGTALDKDLLTKHNKIYSPDTCRFIPRSLNSLLVKRNSKRGIYPIGVSFHKHTRKYRANCNDGNGTLVHLGLFDNQLDAFQAYKKFKESLIQTEAIRYLNLRQIDFTTFYALMAYEVEMTD